MWFVLTLLRWKQSQIFLNRTLVTTEHWAAMKSIQVVKPLLAKMVFWAPSTCTIIFLKLPPLQLHLRLQIHKLLKFRDSF